MRLNEIFLYEILTQIKKVLVAGKVDLNLMVPCQNNYLNEKATFIHLAESSRAANVCGVSSQALQTSSVCSTLKARCLHNTVKLGNKELFGRPKIVP